MRSAIAIIAALVGLTTPLSPTSLGDVPIAHADCVGPTFTHDIGTVRRGTTIVVKGFGWGTDCHDAGPPPPGEGALGLPRIDLEVVIAQSGVELVVARGHADENYSFEVEVTVPATLDPGPITVRVRSGRVDGLDASPGTLRIGDRPASTARASVTPDTDIETFGPATQPVPADAESAGDPTARSTDPSTIPTSSPPGSDAMVEADTAPDEPAGAAPERESDGNESPLRWVLGTGVAVAAVGAVVALIRRRRSGTR